MGCDCKKTYSIGMGCCQPVLAPADNFYTKYQTDMRIEEAISGITVSGITEEQAEEMIEEATSGKANSSDVYTKQEADALLADKQDKLSAGTGIDITNNVISVTGGSQPVDAYTKAETDALLDEKVNVVDNEVEEYPFITKKEDTPEGANFNAASYDDAADTFELIITGTTFGVYDVNNCFFYFINESGETTAKIDGFYIFDTENYVYPTRIQEYVNLDLYEYHTTDRYNLHIKYSGKNGWRLKQFYIYLLTDYNEGVGYIAYQNYPAIQSADAISENVYPALEKLTANKFDKDFTCNDPLLYEAAYKRFRIKTSNQNYDTISGSTSATTNLARAYDVKTYVESKIGSGITSGEVQTMIDNSISGKADTSDVYNKTEVYTKTEVDNKVSVKPNVWCGSESEWSQISGSTEQDTIYLVY